MIGGGFDGTYYGQQGNENIISGGRQRRRRVNGLTYDQRHQGHEEARRHEDRGGRLRRVALVERGGQGPQKYAAPARGPQGRVH